MGQVVVNKFKIGDVVFLISGSPELTVIDTDGDYTHVGWFSGEGKFDQVVIHQNALRNT